MMENAGLVLKKDQKDFYLQNVSEPSSAKPALLDLGRRLTKVY